MDSKKLLAVLAIVALAALGWACLFRTNVIVEWVRRDYRRSNRFVQAWPFSNLVLKSWYPTYLRSMGICFWIFDSLLIYGIFFLGKLP